MTRFATTVSILVLALALPSASAELPYYRTLQGGGVSSTVPNPGTHEPGEPAGPLSLDYVPAGNAFTLADPAAGAFVPTNARQPVSYSSTGLPSGVDVASDGTLTGVFRSAGSFQGSVTVHDGLGRHVSAPFAFQVLPATVSAALPASVRALAPISGTVSVDGGSGWSHSLGGAPASILVDPTTGAVTGTSGSTQGTLNLVPRAQRNGVTVTGATVPVQVTAPQFTVSGIPSIVRTGDTISGHAEGADPGTYSFANAPAWLTVDANGAISGKVPASPTTGSFDVRLNGSRSGTPLAQASIPFSVAPAYQVVLPETTTTYRTAYLTLQPSVTGSGGSTSRTFSKVTGPSFLSVDAQTGTLVFLTEEAASGNHEYRVGVVDADGASGVSQPRTVYVAPQTLTVGGPSAAAWHVGSTGTFSATSNFTVQWSRTKPPFTALVQGPPWTTLSPSGAITAETSEPRAAEPLTVYAFHPSTGQFASRTLTVSVSASTLATSGVLPVDVHVASDISARPFAPTATGLLGSATWTLSAGSLPAGTSVDSSTGRLVGTTGTSSAGTYANLRLRVADADGTSVETDPFTVAVHPAMTVTTATTAYSADAGSAVTTGGTTVANAFGARTLAVETVSGTAPSHTLNQTTGVIAYTAPSGGTWIYRLRATDEAGGDVYGANVTASFVTTELASTAVPLTVNGAALAANTYYSANGSGNLSFPSRSGCSSSTGTSRWIVYDFGKPVRANGTQVYVRMFGGASWHRVEGSNDGTAWTRVWGNTSRNYPNSSYDTYNDSFGEVSYRYWAFATCGSDGTVGRFKLRYNNVSPNF